MSKWARAGRGGPPIRPSLGRGSPTGHLTASPVAVVSQLGNKTRRCHGPERLALAQALGPQFPLPYRKGVCSLGLPVTLLPFPHPRVGWSQKEADTSDAWLETQATRGAPGHVDGRSHT